MYRKWTPTLLLLLIYTALNAQTPFSRGVNLTNWFQAQNAREIQFSRYTQTDFQQIKSLGCDVVRLPINLQGMRANASDNTLDPLFLELLEQVIDWTEALELHLILDNHSFDSDLTADSKNEAALIALWTQMATRFKSRSNRLYFEILNEPHDISDLEWGRIQGEVIKAIRRIDSVHTIVVGPANWNNYHNLDLLPVYPDTNLLYTFHFYDPFLFTHQGATWTSPSMEALANVPFPFNLSKMPTLPAVLKGTWVESAFNQYYLEGSLAKVKELLDIALRFRDSRKVNIYCGELGVYLPHADPAERNYWYEQVIQYLNLRQVPWTSWDYHGGFGLFTPDGQDLFDHDLNIPLLQSMGLQLPPQTPYVAKPDSVGFPIYTDYVAAGVRESSYGAGLLDFYNRTLPAQGTQHIEWKNPGQYDIIGFDFSPNKDLSVLKREGYAVQFFVRSNQAGVRLDVRLMDTKTTSPGDRPWRVVVALDEKKVPGDNQWHWVSIPLSEFRESGAWDNGWFPPEGRFDWTNIDRFELVAEYKALPNTTLSFDQIQIALPGLTAVKALDVLPFTVFPNPSSDLVYLHPSIPGTYEVELVDMQGRVLQSHTVSGDTQLSLAACAPGVYLLRISRGGRFEGTVQVVKTLD